MPTEQTQHTPGPWRYLQAGPTMRDKYSQPFAIGQVGRVSLIAGCFGDVYGGEETAEANARLIMRAPKLLAERDELLGIVAQLVAATDSPGRGFDVILADIANVAALARDALARATGVAA